MSQSTLHWLLVREAHTEGGPPKVLGSYSTDYEAKKARSDFGGSLLELEFEEEHDPAYAEGLTVFYEWLLESE